MSRSGYVEDEDYDGQFAMWRGAVRSSIRGKRGQRLLRDLVEALDAMPEKRLISGALAVREVNPVAQFIFAAQPPEPFDGTPHRLMPWAAERYHGWGMDLPTVAGVCALGAVGDHRGVDMDGIDLDDEDDDWGEVAGLFDIAEPLAREIMYFNDECYYPTPEARWAAMRKWAASQVLAQVESEGSQDNLNPNPMEAKGG